MKFGYTPKIGGIDELIRIYHLRITGWNIHLFTRSVNYLVQEGTNEISLYQFFKMSQWGGLSSTPTYT